MTVSASTDSGNAVGFCGLRILEKSIIPWDETIVYGAFQRMGVCTAMYRYAEIISGKKIRPAALRSHDARLFWKNFADRKDWMKPNFFFNLHVHRKTV